MPRKLSACPIAMTINMVGDKWKIQILRELFRDIGTSKHFSELKRGIEDISDKMLSKSLKELEEDHIIKREVIDSKPPRSVYSLSNWGVRLEKIIYEIDQWGKLYQEARLEGNLQSET